MFRFAAPGRISALYEAAGLHDVVEEDVAVELETSSAAEYWQMMSEHVSLAVAALQRVDERTRERIRATVLAEVSAFQQDGVVRIPGLARCIAGHEARSVIGLPQIEGAPTVQVSLPASSAARSGSARPRAVELLGHQGVVGRPLDRAEDTHRRVPRGPAGQPGQRERVRRVLGVRVVHDERAASTSATSRRPQAADVVAHHAVAPSGPNRIGSPCSSRIVQSSRVSGSLSRSKAPSLKMLQFW